MSIPAVLLLVFRRADLVHRQIEALRPLRPTRLYVAADGPRQGNFADHVECAQARRVLGEIDWPCTVKKLLRSANLGVKLAVTQGIDWFFEHEECGIILEEDCLPHPDFYTYCAALLERYRDDPRIMQISGTNFQPVPRADGASYFFSRYNHVWGWATWRRAWACYRPHFEGIEDFWQRTARGYWANRREKKYWSKMFALASSNRVQTWAYRWTFTIWAEGGLCIYPERNLVTNQGFDARATNTSKPDKAKANRPLEPLGSLVHPSAVSRCLPADRWTFEHLFWGEPWQRTVRRVEKVAALARTFLHGLTARKASAPGGAVFRFQRTRGSPSVRGEPASAYIRPTR
jgi:hypothetical protein